MTLERLAGRGNAKPLYRFLPKGFYQVELIHNLSIMQ